MIDQVTEAEPSTDSEEEQDVNEQSSSSESETEETLLSVLQDAMEKPSEETGSQPEEEIEQEGEEVLEADAESTDEQSDSTKDEDSYEEVPFNKHPRFQELVKEKNEYKVDAERYQNITSFLDENKVSADEAAAGLQIMALMKKDPVEALNALKPYVETLSQAAGYVLPDDIQNKVNDGYMDEDVGKELARSRAEVQNERAQREALIQDQQQQTQQAQLHDVAMSVTDWENKTRSTDPDYDLKQPEIDDRVRVLVATQGRPNTTQDALAMAKQAYTEVNERHKKRYGNKPAMRTASGGNLAGTPQADPQNLMEAVQAAMANGSS
tara:strand:- start:2635 stop:3606 length:972 start_codon:yes stop_codon:yes gene_type:complete